MAHFSVTENIWISDGQAAALASKTSAIPIFWPHTNNWGSGTLIQSAKSAPADGKAYFCTRLNQWTSGGC
jgi:hypothetical protein